MEVELKVKKYKDTGDIAWEYNPLRNAKNEEDEIVDFRVDNSQLNLNMENPIDIECQSSYDGSTNLIFNDDRNPPRIINTRFAVLENNRYKIINRNQIQQTNIYPVDQIDAQTRLFRNVAKIPKVQFKGIDYFGTLKGGNYIFYLKYADSDYNQTDIIAETGIISVFKGDTSNPRTCSEAFMDEKTDKAITLQVKNIDTSFSYIDIYFSRSSCDQNGVTQISYYKIKKEYEIEDTFQQITINGFEELDEISADDINIQYNYVESVKTQAQVQNRLFFANVVNAEEKRADLKNLSLNILAKEIQPDESIGYVDNYNIKTADDVTQSEYYSPYNIYYKLGYFPRELYRFGIVYIYNDDHLSPVYNVRGIDFNRVEKIGDYKYNFEYRNEIEEITEKEIINRSTLENAKGVFRFSSDIEIIDRKNKKVCPLGIQFSIPDKVMNKLKEMKIKGYYFVRQKRIPTFLFSGLSVGVDKVSGVPCIKNGDKWIAESFVNKSRVLTNDYKSKIVQTERIQTSGLLSVDVKCDKQMQSLLGSDRYELIKGFEYKDTTNTEVSSRYYTLTVDDRAQDHKQQKSELLYIGTEVPQKIINELTFSTKAGVQEDVKEFLNFGRDSSTDKDNTIIRGIFTDFVGCSDILTDNTIYDVYIKNYSESFIEEYFKIRINDNAPFYAISDRYALDDLEVEAEAKTINVTLTRPKLIEYASVYLFYKDLRQYIEDAQLDNKDVLLAKSDFELKEDYDQKTIPESKTLSNVPYTLYTAPITYRGDCFTYTTTIRLQRNFTSQSVPINDKIIEPNCWKDSYKGLNDTDKEDWEDINLADVNSVSIGSWITFKGLSNNNIGLRSVDEFNTDEIALMGNPRSFYPMFGLSVKSSTKIPESALYNSGYSTTLGYKRNFAWVEVPYEIDEFDTRIMYSDIQVDGSFKNSYKVFQGLSYKDLDRQYGAIIKILPWSGNILAVFEHAIAIISINEKALIQTVTGQNIHMYGDDVVQKQLSVISDMYGSIWKDSIVRTPRGVYGVDTYAKKIWRFGNNVLELISDFTIQRFLNDEINLKELDKVEILGVRNVKTHFNAYKNDVMFTFYNDNKMWNICYNEVRNMWVTRYSWIPLLSDNINNTYLSFDFMKTKIFGIINTNLRKDSGVLQPNTDWTGEWDGKSDKYLTFELNDKYHGYNITKFVVTGHYWDEDETKIVSKELISKETKKDRNEKGKIINDTYVFEVNENGKITTEYPDNIEMEIYNVENATGTNDKEKQKALYDNYVKIKDKKPFIKFKKDFPAEGDHMYLYYTVDIKYIPYLIAGYEGKIKEEGVEPDEKQEYLVFGAETDYTVGMIIPYSALTDERVRYQEDWNNALLYSMFVHGRSNIIDEINYFNKDFDDQILPTKWYNRQEPFEFEFIVNEPKGMHKIFDNLIIISNNVEPDSIEIQIVGDVFNFSKKQLYRKEAFNEDGLINVEFPELIIKEEDETPGRGYKTDVTWDPILNEYYLNVHADCLDMAEYGRRIGNIHYVEDAWYFQVQPIFYKDIDHHDTEEHVSRLKSTKIRDKYARIRVKYKGDKLVVITALQTLMTQSYA